MTDASPLRVTTYPSGIFGTQNTFVAEWKLKKVIVYFNNTLSITDVSNKIQEIIYNYSDAVTTYGLAVEYMEV